MKKDTMLSPYTHVHIPEEPGNEASDLTLSKKIVSFPHLPHM